MLLVNDAKTTRVNVHLPENIANQLHTGGREIRIAMGKRFKYTSNMIPDKNKCPPNKKG